MSQLLVRAQPDGCDCVFWGALARLGSGLRSSSEPWLHRHMMSRRRVFWRAECLGPKIFPPRDTRNAIAMYRGSIIIALRSRGSTLCRRHIAQNLEGEQTSSVALPVLCTTSRDRSASRSQCHTAAYFFVVQPAIVNFSIPHESMHASASRPVPLPNHTAQDTCPAISKSARRKRTTSNVRPVAFSDWALWAPRMPSCKPLHTNPPSSSRCMDFSRIVSSVHRSVVRPWWCGRRSMFAVKPEDNDVRVSIEDRQRRPNHLNTHQQL